MKQSPQLNDLVSLLDDENHVLIEEVSNESYEDTYFLITDHTGEDYWVVRDSKKDTKTRNAWKQVLLPEFLKLSASPFWDRIEVFDEVVQFRGSIALGNDSFQDFCLCFEQSGNGFPEKEYIEIKPMIDGESCDDLMVSFPLKRENAISMVQTGPQPYTSNSKDRK